MVIFALLCYGVYFSLAWIVLSVIDELRNAKP